MFYYVNKSWKSFQQKQLRDDKRNSRPAEILTALADCFSSNKLIKRKSKEDIWQSVETSHCCVSGEAGLWQELGEKPLKWDLQGKEH